nr:uncharacterized protein LOC9272334 isoform X1 [Oryza sativa Japonica Group]
MPNISPFDFILSGASNRRERCHAHRSSGARSAHRRSNIVAVAINLDQAGASHHATSFTSTSSPFPLKNLEEWCYECGDRPPSSPPPVAVAIVDSASSVDRAVAVFPELYTVAGPSSSPLPLSRLSGASFKVLDLVFE